MALVVLPSDSQCIRCGCTDSQACPGGCSWAALDRNTHEGICSNCVDEETDVGKEYEPAGDMEVSE